MKIIETTHEGFQERLDTLLSRREKTLDRLRADALHIVESYKNRRENFLIEAAREYDGVELSKDTLFVEPDQIKNAHKLVSDELREVIDQTIDRLNRFQNELKANSFQTQEEAGVYWGVEVRPLDRVGLYVPAGYFVALLVSCVQARIAGVEELIIATPPVKKFGAPFIDPAILYVAKIFDVHKILLAGGAAALSALAFGTESTMPVQKIVGPTGKLAMVAKQVLAGYVGFDGVTGPAEVAFICNASTDFRKVAMDILSLAERNPDAEVFVFHADSRWMQSLLEELIHLSGALRTSDRLESIRNCLESNTNFFLVQDLEEAFHLCNRIAPGTLVLPLHNASDHLDKVTSAGSLLMGHFTPPAAFDLVAAATGLVPTMGAAAFAGFSSPQSFVRQFSVMEIQKEALERLKPKSVQLAKNEALSTYEALFDKRLR